MTKTTTVTTSHEPQTIAKVGGYFPEFNRLFDLKEFTVVRITHAAAHAPNGGTEYMFAFELGYGDQKDNYWPGVVISINASAGGASNGRITTVAIAGQAQTGRFETVHDREIHYAGKGTAPYYLQKSFSEDIGFRKTPILSKEDPVGMLKDALGVLRSVYINRVHDHHPVDYNSVTRMWVVDLLLKPVEQGLRNDTAAPRAQHGVLRTG